LLGTGTVEAPDTGLLAVGYDTRLVPHQRGRPGAVDPDVFGLVAHCQRKVRWHEKHVIDARTEDTARTLVELHEA
jgi:hypothetical protein